MAMDRCVHSGLSAGKGSQHLWVQTEVWGWWDGDQYTPLDFDPASTLDSLMFQGFQAEETGNLRKLELSKLQGRK